MEQNEKYKLKLLVKTILKAMLGIVVFSKPFV